MLVLISFSRELISVASLLFPIAVEDFTSHTLGFILNLVLNRLICPSIVILHMIGNVPSVFTLSLFRKKRIRNVLFINSFFNVTN